MSYEQIISDIQTAPKTWLPAILAEVVHQADMQHVFVRGEEREGLLVFVAKAIGRSRNLQPEPLPESGLAGVIQAQVDEYRKSEDTHEHERLLGMTLFSHHDQILRALRLCKLSLDILQRMDADKRPSDLAIVCDGEHQALIDQLESVVNV